MHIGGDCAAVAVGQVVEHDRLVAGGQQLAHAVASNVSGSASDENFHVPDLYCVSISVG
jgi:prephenate dehydrogenase